LNRAGRIALGALPWLAFALACGPLLSGGFSRGHDWSFELVRVAEYQAALAAGQFVPHWAENLYAGYGSPVFVFYAPLFSGAAAVLAWLLGSVASGACAALIVFTGLSVWTCRGMGASACGPHAGPAAAAAARVGVYVYVLHPYLLGDKFLRNADAEFAALCLVPMVVWGVFQARERPRTGFLLVSLGLALSIVAHNLTALVAMGLGLAAAVLDAGGRTRGSVRALAAGVAFGLLLSAFFWVPALALSSWVRMEDLLTGKFDFHRQFPDPGSLFGYARFYATGWLTPAALLAAGVAAVRVGPGPRRRLLLGTGLAAAGLVWLAMPASTRVWETLPLLPLFQFPWRMLGPLALVTALAAALAFRALLADARPAGRIVAEVAVFALCAANALPLLARVEPLPASVQAQLAERLSPEAVRRGRQSVTVRDEYLPRGADPGLWESRLGGAPAVTVVSGDASIDQVDERGSQLEFRVRAGSPARLRAARWAFPGWRLEFDGSAADWRGGSDGALELSVPAGETRVLLRRRAPGVRRGALAVSVLAALAGLAGLAWESRRRRGNGVS
jgi:hypothetical protein